MEKHSEDLSKENEAELVEPYGAASDTKAFWNDTDAETVSLLVQEYQSVKDYSRAMRKKLSKADQNRISNASASELEDLMRYYMDQASRKQVDLDCGQGRAVRAERGTHRFLDNFNGYVQAYSGVVAIMKGAGFGYGEAAYGALQLFLIISVNKEKTEDFIGDMLVELRQQYHRIQMLKDVYPTKRMREYTAILYRLGVQFLHEAVRYYSAGAWRRIGYVFAHPPSIAVEKKVKEIKDAIRETEREMRALDGLRLNQMEQVQAGMEYRQQQDHRTLGEVSTILNALQTRTDNDRLDLLRRLLNLDSQDAKLDAHGYELDLNETFCCLKRLRPLDVDRQVFDHPQFVTWRANSLSALFLLHGATVAPEQTSHSWNSSAAVRVVSNFNLIFPNQYTNNSSILLTHYLHHRPDTISAIHEKVSPTTVIATLILQVLRSGNGRSILRNEEKYEFLKQSLEALDGCSSRQITEQCRRLTRIMIKLLKELNVNCLVVVVDRIDKFQGGMEKAVEILEDLIESAKLTVKVFATARSRAGFDDADVKERLEGRYTRLSLSQDG